MDRSEGDDIKTVVASFCISMVLSVDSVCDLVVEDSVNSKLTGDVVVTGIVCKDSVVV